MLGSYAPSEHTWCWVWANSGLENAEQAAIRRVRDETDLALLRQPGFDCTEPFSFAVAALAAHAIDRHLHPGDFAVLCGRDAPVPEQRTRTLDGRRRELAGPIDPLRREEPRRRALRARRPRNPEQSADRVHVSSVVFASESIFVANDRAAAIASAAIRSARTGSRPASEIVAVMQPEASKGPGSHIVLDAYGPSVPRGLLYCAAQAKQQSSPPR